MDLDVDTVYRPLSTIRAIRRRLDLTRPVTSELITTCVEPALQAPIGGDQQNWDELQTTSTRRNQMITVMGATGNTGRKVTEALLAAGEEIRALGRSPEKLDELEALGAETVTGDVRDAQYLAGAFAGADAVYTLTAFDPTLPDSHADQARRSEAIVAAIRESGVRHVVVLSSLGAERKRRPCSSRRAGKSGTPARRRSGAEIPTRSWSPRCPGCPRAPRSTSAAGNAAT